MTVVIEPSLSPQLCVDSAVEAIEFYINAFDGVELGRVVSKDGKLIHAAVLINGSVVLITDDFPEYTDGKSLTPIALGGSPCLVSLEVPDVNASFKKAVDAGATVIAPLREQFWGSLYGILRDPFGHQWALGQPMREVSLEELAANATPVRMTYSS